MTNTSQDSETIARFWDELLSRQPERIRKVFQLLDPATCSAVIAHLRRMTTEDGWHSEQKISAQAAIDALRDLI